MNCAWNELLSVIPPRFRQQIDLLGKEDGLELRLRLDRQPILVRKKDSLRLSGNTTQNDLHYVVNMASKYSPWTAATMACGDVTAPGGHRIGLCGQALMKEGEMVGIQQLQSLNIRIARDWEGISKGLSKEKGNMLILGRPGSGKTTLLRDLIRQLSYRETVCVVDERGELFPPHFHRGDRMDVLIGCEKRKGIDCVLRTMSPDTIAIDEVTAKEDTQGFVQAAWCGVRLLATCHAIDQRDLYKRKVYQPIIESNLFSTFVIMHEDKSFRLERSDL